MRVQAGVVKDQLTAAVQDIGLFFAPELCPSNRATIGGMIATCLGARLCALREDARPCHGIARCLHGRHRLARATAHARGGHDLTRLDEVPTRGQLDRQIPVAISSLPRKSRSITRSIESSVGAGRPECAGSSRRESPLWFATARWIASTERQQSKAELPTATGFQPTLAASGSGSPLPMPKINRLIRSCVSR